MSLSRRHPILYWTNASSAISDEREGRLDKRSDSVADTIEQIRYDDMITTPQSERLIKMRSART